MFTDRRANSLRTRREPQPWPRGRPFRILSLDGGGIRGLYSASLLHQCQTQICGERPLASCFDMIAGTSTGGIIALGLGLGYSTQDILDFYRCDGRRIFPPLPQGRICKAWRWFTSLRTLQLDHTALEEALKRRFGERLLGDSDARLVIPAFMMPKTEIAVFKTDHHPDFERDWKTPAWKVARATSAAPTYLKGHEDEMSRRIFIDGGVWANNPVMVALVDALTAYDVQRDQIEVLSIGTGNPPFQLNPRAVFGGLVAWREIIKAAMFLTTDNATAQAMLLLGPERCLRVEPKGDAAFIELDDYDGALKVLPDLAQADFDMARERIAEMLARTAAPRERHHSRNDVRGV